MLFQLQLAYSLMKDGIRSGSKLWHSIQAQMNLYGTKDSMEHVAAPFSVHTPPQVAGKTTTKNSSSGPLELPHLGVTTISETSESVSRAGTPRPDSDGEPGVKLSLWLQWTLLKLGVKLYGKDTNDKGTV